MQNKSKKLTSRLLSALLALACVLTLLPGVAVAAETMTMLKKEEGSMVLEKGAVLEDDGTYTIQLSAYATGTTTTVTQESSVPLDIVLVLDQSGSMHDNGYVQPLKTAVTNFVNAVSANGKKYEVDHRVALVGYASRYDSNAKWTNTGLFINGSLYNYQKEGSSTRTTRLTAQDYKNALVSVNDENWKVSASITTAIDNITSNGATYTNYGMEMANGVFSNNPIEEGSKRKRVVIVFTDGEPGRSSYEKTVANAALEEAYKTKNTYGATVYTVGLYNSEVDEDVTKFMHFLSSNYPTVQSMDDSYVYTPVYSADLDTNKTYYIQRYNGYRAVRYSNRFNGWYGNYEEYTPKTSADDTNSGHTQFYTVASGNYYMVADEVEKLNGVFTSITEDIQNPSTKVTLDDKSVMRDILNGGFVIPSGGCTVTTKTQNGTMQQDGTIVWEPVADNSLGSTFTAHGPSGVIDVTGFNYSEQYIAKGHPGQKLSVTIQGVEARDEAITNAPISTNTALSGIYATPEEETPAVTFPQPTTILKSKTYVLDYGKPVNLASQDWGIGSVTTLNGAGMYKFTPSESQLSLTKTYGKVATATAKTGLTYTPITMNWNGYDSFYVFGKQIEGGVINQWSKVTVMPANSVYYEDTFVTDANAGTVGIVYGGEWKTDGTDADRDQTLDSGHPYGWETGYAGDTGYSDGSAHKAVASAENKATASFTFTGTGVDVYSRTDLTTGTVAATLTKKVNGEQVGVKGLVVDNLAASAGENGAYYQIPTLFFDGLDYGEYTLTLYVTTAAENRATYYLDGVRVYNPIQPKEEDAVVKEAYGAAGELGASFQSVREILLTAEDFDPTTNNTTDGVVFIDQDGTTTGTTTQVIGTYKEYGPKNEVYLAQGQSIAFKVSDLTANYYLGIKAPNGKTTAKVTWEENAAALPVNAASDLYYQVTPNADGYILVKNTGENLLSVTKLRTTNGKEQASITTANVDDLLAYANTFDTLEEITYSTQPGEVEIENPEVNELGDGSIVRDWLEKIFKGIRDLLRP